jgi:hypothetical protein
LVCPGDANFVAAFWILICGESPWREGSNQG